jgi:hypothetical protein
MNPVARGPSHRRFHHPLSIHSFTIPTTYLHLPPLHRSRAASLDTRDETESIHSFVPTTLRCKAGGTCLQRVLPHKGPKKRGTLNRSSITSPRARFVRSDPPRRSTTQHDSTSVLSRQLIHPSIVYRTGASRYQPTQVPDPLILTTGTQPQSSLPIYLSIHGLA